MNNILWFYTTSDSPSGKVVSLKITQEGQYSWHDVIEESSPISAVSITGNKIIINYLKDTLTDVKFFDLEGNHLSNLNFPNIGSINGFYGNINTKPAYFEFTNYTSPEEVYEIDLDTLSYEPYWKSDIPGFNADEYLSAMQFYTSSDGTQIPIHIASQKGLNIDLSLIHI